MLHELETAFRDGALKGEVDAAIMLVRADAIAADDRIAVYTNNIIGSLIEVLENTFPAIRRHVGEDNFAVIAGAFVRAQPPARPQLDLFGGAFAEFLAGFEPARENLPWLPDLARLEWAYHDSYFAPGFDPAALSEVAPEDFAGLTFAPHPATRAVASVFPVHAIWQAETLSDVTETGYQALVARPELDVAAYDVDSSTFEMFTALAAGETLANAAAVAQAEEVEFDLQAALVRLIEWGVFRNR
jgi:hypothetical protein